MNGQSSYIMYLPTVLTYSLNLFTIVLVYKHYILNSAGREECEMLVETGIVKNICNFFLHQMPRQLIRPYIPPEEVKL